MPRFEHGSRVPGWDRGGRPREGPGGDPRPRARPRCRRSCARRSRRTWRNYPDRRSAALPALAAAQRVHGWCSPRGDRAGRLRDARDARLPGRRWRPSTTCSRPTPVGAPQRVRVHEHLLLAARRRRAVRRRSRAAAGDDPEFNVRAFECLGACDIAPMASVDGVYVGPLDARRRAAAARRRARRAPGAAREAARAPARRRPARQQQEFPRAIRRRGRRMSMAAAGDAPILLFTRHRRAGAEHARGLRTPRRLRVAAQGARDDARGGARSSSKPRACAGAAARASRWARRSRSCPRARWTSTWCATPTSPSRGRSRTAN